MLFSCSVSAAVLDDATFEIQEGWNAVYLPVTPEASADEVFADWPVDKVGMYDQAAFLRTKQFEQSASDTTLGAVESGMKIWVRGEPGKSTFRRLVANGIYVFNATQDVANVVVRGVPEALRTSWHVSVSTNQPLNFVGVSVTPGATAELTEAGYFRGLDTGWTIAKGVIRDPWGFDTEPTLDFFYDGTPKKGNLGVVAMDAPKVSDWSGALFVSPMTGVNFSTNACQATLTIRNDGGTNRVAQVALRSSANGLPVPAILYRDARVGDEWKSFTTADPPTFELQPSATLTLQLAIDRTQFAGVAVGAEYGAIVDVTDVSTANPTYFHTAVPLLVKVGGDVLGAPWPAGLWTANLSLGKVGDKRAGSTMAMRVLVHVDEHGVMNLMQRARVGERRISSVVLPTDMSAQRGTVTTNNWRMAGDGTVARGGGTFGKSATFAWTVSDKSRINPFRHAKHPDHDGLDWDFKDTLPSGDNFTNYVASVKPELFSISNRVEMVWDAHDGASWNPQETLTGTCVWWLYGLRHEGGIKTSGTFTMKRVSKADIEAIKEEL